MNRQELKDLISEKELELENLIRLEKTMSDENQQYYEKWVDVEIKRRPKLIEKQLHGFIKWKEKFKDESTNKKIEIERNMLIRVNGKFIR